MKRGAMIVIEGCDCSGKSSQSRRIVNILNERGIPAELMCFPDRTTHTGQLISSYLASKINLPDQAIHLLFSANRWEAAPKIMEKLTDGVSLVIDRYSYSGVAYSYAKKGALDMEWYKNPEKELPKPDLVLFLELAQEVITQRKGFGSERYENDKFQASVHKIFHEIRDHNWKVIDADMPMNDLTDHLLKEIIPVIDKVNNKPILRMW